MQFVIGRTYIEVNGEDPSSYAIFIIKEITWEPAVLGTDATNATVEVLQCSDDYTKGMHGDWYLYPRGRHSKYVQLNYGNTLTCLVKFGRTYKLGVNNVPI